MGYLSNKSDSKLLNRKEYQKKISENIVKAVQNYFNWVEKNNN
jgi:N-acetylmuramoyl-L-alanine amidase